MEEQTQYQANRALVMKSKKSKYETMPQTVAYIIYLQEAITLCNWQQSQIIYLTGNLADHFASCL